MNKNNIIKIAFIVGGIVLAGYIGYRVYLYAVSYATKKITKGVTKGVSKGATKGVGKGIIGGLIEEK